MTRFIGFRGRPWSRKSPTAIMRCTRKTHSEWFDTLPDGPSEGSPLKIILLLLFIMWAFSSVLAIFITFLCKAL